MTVKHIFEKYAEYKPIRLNLRPMNNIEGCLDEH